MESHGQPRYRSRQLFEAIYRQRLGSISQVSTLPQSLRDELLAQGVEVGLPTLEKKFVSVDGTVRYLIAFRDGQSVETVWMPEGDGGEAGDGTDAGDEEEGTRRFDRATICVSSQVGCAVNCQFCMTALLGVRRSLTAGEILGQIVAVLNDRESHEDPSLRWGLRRRTPVALTPAKRLNLVFMGMGEPFLNYDNFMQAVRLLVDGVGVAESRMTVSTAGIVPRIADFGREAVRPKLAISLNASNDEQRDRLMPLNRKWNLEKLIGAARQFPLRPRERLTFEYVLLDRVNDTPQNAREVVELLRGLRCKVNLIALNPGPEIPFGTPAEERVLEFQHILTRAGIPTFIRRPRGRDIYAACGQLKKTVTLGP